MKKFVGVVSTLVLAVGVLAAAPAQAGTSGSGEAAKVSAKPKPKPKPMKPTDRYWREPVRMGDRDAGVFDIEHVRELQYRLRWAKVYKGPVTGTFGGLTRNAVKRYQKREDLKVTGRATSRTWRHLLPDTLQRKGAVPQVCKRRGWHACYDRTAHQLTLWHRGKIHNTWLVRGGSYYTPTRLGTNTVFKRDIDHKSGLFQGAPMPYSQFFDGGQAIHGSRFMIDPFVDHSHGCINMYVEDARLLWRLTSDKVLNVTVYGAWDKTGAAKSSAPVEP